MLEISAALGRVLVNTNNARALALLGEFEHSDNFRSAEIVIAALRVGPKKRDGKSDLPDPKTWRQFSTMAQFLGEAAKIEASNDDVKKLKAEAPEDSFAISRMHF